jgi:hypothetical protein
MKKRILRIGLMVGWAIAGSLSAAQPKSGTLDLAISDKPGGPATPARVELLDAAGKAYVADDAILVGPGYPDRVAPWQGDLARALSYLARPIDNPYTRTTQFYSTGTSRITLPAGTYRLRVFKGIEFTLETREVRIAAGETVSLKIPLSRWINLPEQGWFSADDHLHISRPLAEMNHGLAQWMQAEDLNVANLLQFGTWNSFAASPQYAHGPAGVYREGDYLLVSGQENPRVHFMGHTIVLGAKAPIHLPEGYLIFRNFWEEARRQGGLSGYAHWGVGSEAQAGLAVDLPGGLLDFIEVLECWDAHYDIWYEILNSGIRMSPTAGTDYGSVPSLPGRERFYTAVKGPLAVDAWLEGIRRGATFVTNGPILEFRVSGKGMGEELVLPGAGTVVIEARVRCDPARDDLNRLEVVRNGQLLKSFPRAGSPGEIRCQFEQRIDESCWLAVRSWGDKVGEASPPDGFVPPFRNRYRGAPASLSHSGAIYVTVAGTPGLAHHDRAKALARVWLARLDELERRLDEDKLKYLAREAGDYVPNLEYLRRHRPALLQAIQNARKYYLEQAK